ncbi:MAG TPA: NAD(P) transhydrogenase subunit alpha [Thermomicrobiales bacterium]|nr:NAD(P) transhydrogenase subunit alpha [Thermomicrobiales bacterium]
MDSDFMLGIYILTLAIFLGAVLIMRVPSTLHTPLMSATNMISGIVLIGAMLVVGSVDSWWLQVLGFLAIAFSAANVVGGYAVTDRMLKMFKQRAPAAGTSGKGER